MAIGSGRNSDGNEREGKSFAFKALAAAGILIVAFILYAVIGYSLHRHNIGPQGRAREDREAAEHVKLFEKQQALDAAKDKLEEQQKARANAKRAWIDHSRFMAHERITAILKDPESAQFGVIGIVDDPNFNPDNPGTACGDVNAKNSFGGYTGRKSFMVIAGIPMIEDGGRAFVRLWKKECTKPQL
jgi:hypothetical protein